MKKQYIKYIVAAVILLLIGVLVINSKPKKTDWSPSFSSRGKLPYGTYVLKQRLGDIFPEQKVRVNFNSYYTFFNEQGLENDTQSNLLIISKEVEPDALESKRLMEYAARGNRLFISCASLRGKLADTLKVAYDYSSYYLPTKTDGGNLNFVHPKLKRAKDYSFKHLYQFAFFEKFDTTKTVLIGTDDRQRAVFIEVKVGKGSIFLHSLPAVFSNYGLLYQQNDEYAAKCLSYLPKQTIIWDEYFKPDRVQNTDLFRYLQTDDALRAAYYLLVVGLVLFFAFGTKRRQRAIQVIRRPVNASLEFIHTVGRLYFRRKNNHDLVSKQYAFLLDHFRTRYYLHVYPEQAIDIEMVSQKTGIKHKTVMALFSKFNHLLQQPSVSDSELIDLNHQLEKMKDEEQL